MYITTKYLCVTNKINLKNNNKNTISKNQYSMVNLKQSGMFIFYFINK